MINYNVNYLTVVPTNALYYQLTMKNGSVICIMYRHLVMQDMHKKTNHWDTLKF